MPQSLVTPGREPPGRDAEETEQLWAGRAGRREGSRPGSPHRSTHWLRLTVLGHGRGPCRPRQPPRATCHTPSRYRQHPLLRGETLSVLLVPYPSSLRGHGCPPGRHRRQEWRGPGRLHTLGSRRPGQPSGSHRSRSLGRHPHLRLFCLWADPAGSPGTSSFRSEGEEEALGLQHQEAGSEVTPRRC